MINSVKAMYPTTGAGSRLQSLPQAKKTGCAPNQSGSSDVLFVLITFCRTGGGLHHAFGYLNLRGTTFLDNEAQAGKALFVTSTADSYPNVWVKAYMTPRARTLV